MLRSSNPSIPSYWDNVDFETEILKPITLKLGHNELIFQDSKNWNLQTSDIEYTSEQVKELQKTLTETKNEMNKLKQQIQEMNETKSVVFDMVSYLSI